MRKLMCALVICLIGGMAFGAEATFMEAPDLPSSVLVVTEWPNLATLQGNVEGFVNAIKPGSPVPPIAGLLSGITKSVDPMALVLTLPQRVILVKDAEGDVSSVAVLRVTDSEAFMESLSPTLEKAGTGKGLDLYVEKKQVFNREAYSEASPEQRMNPMQFMQPVENPVVIGTSGNFALVGKLAPAVTAAMDMVESGVLGEKPALGEGDLTVVVNVGSLMEAGEAGLFDELREKAMSAMPFGQMGPQGAQTEEVLVAEMDACQAVLAQVDTFQASLSLSPRQATLKFGMDALPGTELAGYLSSVPQGMPETLKYLPQDAFLVAAGRMGDMGPLVDSLVGFQAKIMGIQDTDSDMTANMARLAEDALQAYGDDFCAAMYPGGGISLIEVIRLKDKAAADALMEGMSAISEQVTEMYESAGMPMAMGFDPAAHTYKEHEISEWTISVTDTPTENADPAMAAMLQQQKAAMKALFGEGLKIDGAMLDNDWVLTIGDDALGSLKGIIDGGFTSVSERPAFQQALASVPTNSEAVMYLRLPDMIKWSMSLGARMGQPMPPQMAQLKFADSPGIVAACNVSGVRTVCDVSVPTAEFRSVLNGFMQMTMMRMQVPPQPPQRGPRGFQESRGHRGPRGERR